MKDMLQDVERELDIKLRDVSVDLFTTTLHADVNVSSEIGSSKITQLGTSCRFHIRSRT